MAEARPLPGPRRTSWRSSLRTRLVLWFVAVLTATLAAFGAGLYLSVRHGLWREFDLRLQRDVDSARGLLAPFWTVDGVTAPDYISPLPENDRRWLEVWTRQGERLFQSPEAEAAPLDGAGAPLAAGIWSTRSSALGPRRVLDAHTDIIGLPVAIRVVEPETELRAQLRAIASSIAVGFVLCVAVAIWGGHRLTRRALRPMERLAEQAAAITADRLGRGLAVDRADDEVGALAAALDETLRRLDVSFEQARRFSADASHELRTPLTSLRAVGQVALQEPRGAEAYRETIASMVEDAERLTRLLDTLLLLSRADAGEVTLAAEAVDLGALVRDVAGQFDVLAEEKQQTLAVDAAAVHVRGDAGVLRLAIGNLIDNAVRYTPAGGRIAVRATAAQDRAVVEVEDSGPGIAAEHHPRLFDRFYRADPARSRQSGGSGLGLSIAQWAAVAHHGRITVHSVPGAGSTFRIELPAGTDPNLDRA